MKNGLIAVLTIVGVAAVIYGVSEHQGKEVYREENMRLRDEIRKITNEATAARVEAAKLRQVILLQKERAEELTKKR